MNMNSPPSAATAVFAAIKLPTWRTAVFSDPFVITRKKFLHRRRKKIGQERTDVDIKRRVAIK
jgi:hypothetical protein